MMSVDECEKIMRDLKNETTRIEGNYMDAIHGKNKFHHSKIYKIISKNTDRVYIGSTTKCLEHRLSNHVSDYKEYKKTYNIKHGTYASMILNFGNYSIELIENICCENKKELEKIEGKWQKNTPNRVNKNVAGRTLNEYRYDNKGKIKESRQKYYEENKDEIKKCVNQYRENNKDEIKKKKSKKDFCEIWSKTYTHSNKNQHENSKKHQKYILQNPAKPLTIPLKPKKN